MPTDAACPCEIRTGSRRWANRRPSLAVRHLPLQPRVLVRPDGVVPTDRRSAGPQRCGHARRRERGARARFSSVGVTGGEIFTLRSIPETGEPLLPSSRDPTPALYGGYRSASWCRLSQGGLAGGGASSGRRSRLFAAPRLDPGRPACVAAVGRARQHELEPVGAAFFVSADELGTADGAPRGGRPDGGHTSVDHVRLRSHSLIVRSSWCGRGPRPGYSTKGGVGADGLHRSE